MSDFSFSHLGIGRQVQENFSATNFEMANFQFTGIFDGTKRWVSVL